MDPYISEALKLFDTADKWHAFIELSHRKDLIRDGFSQQLQCEIMKRFGAGIIDKWDCSRHTCIPDVRWDIKDFGKEGIGIVMGWGCTINLHLWNMELFDLQKATKLLNDAKYEKIVTAFWETSEGTLIPNSQRLIAGKRNYKFDENCPFNGNFEWDHLAWYIKNDTRFVEQVADKINYLTSKLTSFIYDLNVECKK